MLLLIHRAQPTKITTAALNVPNTITMSPFIFRINDLTNDVNETRKRREKDLKELETTTKEMAKMSDAEKQGIVVQISAVQTELRNSLESRYLLKRSRISNNKMEF